MPAAIVACCLAWIPASASAATVSGRVFNDFNTNGVFDTNANAGAVDVPVSGLTVQAFTGTGTLVGTAVTGSDGAYTLNLPDTRVRLQLDVVRPWWPTRQLSGLRSDVQFVDASSARTGVDFGVHRLSEYSFDNPTLFWPTQWAGPPDGRNSDEIAIRGAPYFSRRPRDQLLDWECGRPASPSPCRQLDNPVKRATFGEVGTVSGLAMDQRTEALYAGAYYKRLAGLKDRRTGAIYRIARDGHVSLFANIDAGTDRHPTTANINEWVDCAGATVQNPGTCDTSWNLVGNTGLGSVVIDAQDQNLYTVNLHDKRLYRFALNGRSRRGRGRRAASTPIPDPGCANGDWRPFSAAFDRVNEQLYVGGVCSAETSQNRDNLRAVVYRVDNPRSATPSFVQVLDFPLDYERARTPATAITTPLTFCATPRFCRWNPWPTVLSTGGRPPTSITGPFAPITENNNPAFPQLTAITFAEDGSMILAFRDLIGDMGGPFIPGEVGGAASQAGYGPMIHGDMLRAGANANGTFSLEQEGRVAGLTSAGQATTPNINWNYGAGIGPGGGYFYNPAPLATPLPVVNQNETYFNIPHPYQGGLTQIPGFLDVVATSIHIRTSQANGLLWRNNRTGDTDGGLQNFVTPNPSDAGFSGFAKAGGLGDIDAFTGLAPVQIGNRLWYDVNRNGIQDADENPVAHAVVELVNCDGYVVGTTETDAVGEYVFNVEADRCYRVRVPLDQRPLHGWVPTTAFAGNQVRLDSNGRVMNGRSVAFVPGHGTGQNDHTYDFGFHQAPPPPPEEPRPPIKPRLPGRLVVVKHVLSESARTVRFVMVVRNAGPQPITRVRVCDRLPAGLEFVSATRPGRRVSGRQVCWFFASLSSGEEHTLRLTARSRAGALPRHIVNCARATGRNVRARRACVTTRKPPAPPVTG